MESESYEKETRVFKRNSLFELYCAQTEAAKFLKLAYLSLKKDPKFAIKVHKIAYDALNQHLKTQRLMIDFEDTANYVVETLMPRLKKELEEKNANPIKKILEDVLGYVNRMIKETKDAVNRCYALKEAVQNQITDIFDKYKEVKIMNVEMNQKLLQGLLLSRKDEYDGLQVKTKELEEKIKNSKKKRQDFLYKSMQTEDCKEREAIMDGLLIPRAAVAATIAGGPVLGGAVFLGGLVASNIRRSQASQEALDASDKVKEDIEKSKNALDDAMERQLKMKEDSIEKIIMLQKLTLESADETSLNRAYDQLREVDRQFSKICLFSEVLCSQLNTLIGEKDVVEVLLDVIDDEEIKEDLNTSTNNITEVWSSFRRACAYYVNKNDGEIHDLYSFLSDPMDQLSI